MKTNRIPTQRIGGALTLPTVILLLACAGSRADGSETWTVDDLVRQQYILEVTVSPADPRVVVWVQQEADEKKDRFLTQLVRHGPEAEGEPVQLTHGEESSQHPRFSPDGRRLAFLRKTPAAEKDEESKTHIWLMEGGEPRAVTEGKRDIRGFAWRDAHRLVFYAQEAPSRREEQLKEKKDKARVVDDEENEPPVRLFELNVTNKTVAPLTTNRDRISFLALSPNGRYAVTFHEQSLRFEYDNTIPPHYFIHDLESGQARRILETERVTLQTAVWAPDSSRFYVVLNRPGASRYLNYGTIPEVWEVAPATGNTTRIPLDWDRGVANMYYAAGIWSPSPLIATADGFVVLLADGARLKSARYSRTEDGWPRGFLEGPNADQLGSLWCGAKAGEHWLYGVASAANRPSQLVRARLAGTRLEETTVISRLNPTFAKKPAGEREILGWRGGGGQEVEGILHRPAGRSRESAGHSW